MNQISNQLPSVKKLSCMLLSAILLITFCISMVVADDRPQLQPLKPPAGFDSREVDFSQEITQYFDFIGVIVKIEPQENRIDVLHKSFPLAWGTRTAGFQRGMYVGVKLNDNNEVFIIEQLQSPGDE